MPAAPVPQYCPTPVELDDLELLASGALGGLRGFNQPDSPVTLHLPADVEAQARAAGAVELVDPEGVPLARVSWPAGAVEPLGHPEYGPFRRLMLTPAAYRERYAGRTVVPVAGPLTQGQVQDLSKLGPLTLLTLTGTGTAWLSPGGLVRATRAAAELLPDAVVVTAPLASHSDPESHLDLGVRVVEAFAAGDPVHALAEDEDGSLPEAVAEVVEHDRPPPDRQGLVVFFTGLSGSGKSTLARALVDLLLEQGERTVTSLDGDVVRRNLSAGLTFSKEDRETNIRRIGWVAAEISRHGGVAVVSPIAPFDETRKQVRAMVEDAGGALFLVHVATPLEECERRDRKDLYAKARAGLIPEFTGISSPYEEPQDADVRVDTTGRTIEDALHDVLVALRDAGYVDLLSGEDRPPAPARPSPPPVEPVETPCSPNTSSNPSPVESVETQARPAEPDPLVEPVETLRSATQQTAEPATQQARRPLKVLFVCTANICRSPTVELLARQEMPDETDIVFSSAGTHGSDGGPLYEDMAHALPPELITADFRSRRLTPDLLRDADLVLTMEAAHRTYILADHPEMFRKVFTLGQFAQAVGRAPAGLDREALLAHVATARGTADPALDVEDPYRRGAEAASGCVARLQDLLRAVLPALAR